jgi:hypothetical protein
VIRRQIFTTLLLGVLALVSAGCVGNERSSGVESNPLGPGDPTTYEYTVPFGTGNRLDNGEVIEVMPQTLTVKVGESIRITNDDIRDYMIGPFFVTAGQTLAMRFTHTGELSGVCLVNPEGQFIIKVTE